MRTWSIVICILVVASVYDSCGRLEGKNVNLASLLNRPSESVIKYNVKNYNELISRFGEGNCDKNTAEGIQYALCYETWTSANVKGFLHVYKYSQGEWYLIGVIVAGRRDYKITKSSQNSLTIDAGWGNVYEIPFSK
jgi:hypothetical protein